MCVLLHAQKAFARCQHECPQLEPPSHRPQRPKALDPTSLSIKGSTNTCWSFKRSKVSNGLCWPSGLQTACIGCLVPTCTVAPTRLHVCILNTARMALTLDRRKSPAAHGGGWSTHWACGPLWLPAGRHTCKQARQRYSRTVLFPSPSHARGLVCFCSTMLTRCP